MTTTTTEQIQKKCRSIILKLKQTSMNLIENDQERILNDSQEWVNHRFDKVVRRFVIDDNKQINAELLKKLKKSKIQIRS